MKSFWKTLTSNSYSKMHEKPNECTRISHKDMTDLEQIFISKYILKSYNYTYTTNI